jgi:hypothetical protein
VGKAEATGSREESEGAGVAGGETARGSSDIRCFPRELHSALSDEVKQFSSRNAAWIVCFTSLTSRRKSNTNSLWGHVCWLMCAG